MYETIIRKQFYSKYGANPLISLVQYISANIVFRV